MPRIGASLESASPHAMESSESWTRFARLLSPNLENMVLDDIQIRLPPNSAARVALYVGGASDTDPAGASLIFEGLASNATGSAAVVTVAAAQEAIPANARLWLAHKGTNEDRYFVYTVGDPHPGDGPDTEAGDLLSAAWDWGPSASINTDTSSPWPSTLTTSEPLGGNAVMMALTYSTGGGPTPSVISDPTPSGTIGTTNTATVGCTTDTEEGTLYVVLSETDNVEEADPEEIEAGENENGDPADFADDAAVTDSTPEVAFSGLDPETTYYYAMVHKTDDGYSNVLSGSFTTAAADIVATKLQFTAQPGNTVVGQTMSAVQVAAVDDDNELDTDFDGDVTIALQTGDGPILGALVKAAVGGLATFDDLVPRTLNEGAVLRATADGLTQADSNEFDITAGGSGGTTGLPSSSRLGGLLQ